MILDIKSFFRLLLKKQKFDINLLVIYMDMNMRKLLDIFKNIYNKGWIATTNNGYGSVSLTFLKELGKINNAIDLNSLEIKCTTRFSDFPIFLFSINTEEVLASKKDYIINNITDKKVIYTDVYFNKKVLINHKKKGQLVRDGDKLLLNIYDNDDNFIKSEVLVYLSSIYNFFEYKLENIAYIRAFHTVREMVSYFKYYYISFLSFRGIDTFLELLDNDLINITLIARKDKKDNRFKICNINFTIDKDNLKLLYKTICYYNCIHR